MRGLRFFKAVLSLTLFCCVDAWAAALGAEGAPAADAEPYVFGAFPHLPPRELEKVYAPIAADLGRALGRAVEFRSASSFDNFIGKAIEESYEIVFVQPFDYVKLHDEHGYVPLATRGEPLSAIFVAVDASPLKTVADLRRNVVATPPESAAVTLLARDYLARNGIDPDKDITVQFHRSHVSCLQQVVIGDAAACATAAPALRFFEHRMNTKLKTLGASEAIPHTLFAVHPRVPEAERARLLATILHWGDTEEGRRMLEAGQLTPFVEIDDAAYNRVREMLKKH